MSRSFATLLFTILASTIWAQCGSLSGDSPAFEINVPAGVQVDSAVLIIENYNSMPLGIRSRGRSFNNFETTAWFEVDGSHPMLIEPLVGPITADYQIDSGIDGTCRRPNDHLDFAWTVLIHCSGVTGVTLDHSGPLTDNLASPTFIGSVYAGTNIVSGIVDNTLGGPGELLYPDWDSDGFGAIGSEPVAFCSYCDFYADNALDCDDDNYLISPDAVDIPDNGIDENCDGDDATTSIHELAEAQVSIYPNPASTVINIRVNGQLNYRASLYDLAGHRILTSTRPATIDIRSLANGIYVLEIHDLDTQQRVIERIVKGD